MTGSGHCSLQVSTFDDLEPVDLLELPLTPTTSRILQRLANYSAQGIMLRGASTEIDDTITVQDITLYLKQIYTEYPQ